MLPYSSEAYFALFSAYNEAIRPVPALALFLAAGIIALAMRSRQNRSRPVAAILVAGWLWTGLLWHYVYFHELNFMAPVYAGVFILQALLLGWFGIYRNELELRYDGSFRSRAGVSIMLVAALVMPLSDWVSGHSWSEARFALIAPAATAGLTAGLMLLTVSRSRYVLVAIPVLWLLATGIQGWILEIPQDYVPAVLGLLALAGTMLPLKRRPD